MSDFTFKQVNEKLKEVIKTLQIKDEMFLNPDFDINERSVTHRLALHLTPLFAGYDVDCECNRVYNEDSDEYIAKNVDLPKIEHGITVKDLVAKTVYPDIVVHKRGQKTNILAIEVKMKWKADKGWFDLIKAEAYRRRLDYNYSVFLVLGPRNNYEIKWIDHE